MNVAPRSRWGLASLAILLAIVAGLALATSRSFAAAICDSCVTVVDSCCSRMPHIQDPVFQPPARGVVETREPDLQTPWPYCVTLYDVTQNIPPENTNWNPITRYHGPGGNWNATNLGTVFGLTLDKYGNIYVTHTSCYSSDIVGPGGPGAIYRIDANTGAITTFATLPNVADPNIPAGVNLPGLGNISYDCDHDQFFVTNMEDGRIYRIKSSNALNASPATVLNFFDPGMPDNGTPGWAPLGDRLWAVQWHGNRVYYSIWATDIGSPPGINTIRSLALDGSGNFVWFSDQHEISVPVGPGMTNQSSPVSDLSFGPTGRMLLAERTMFGPTNPSAHQSRVLEYECHVDPGTVYGAWVPSPNIFKPGQIGTQDNAAGGVDYDFTTYDGPSPPATAPPGTGGSQGRVWATSDAIHLGFPYTDIIYGLQAFRPTGGTITTSLLIDSDSNVGSTDKTFIGDVEVPCAPSQVYEICGFKFLDQNKNGVKDASEPFLSGWTIQLAGPTSGTVVTDANGQFCFSGLPAGTYTVSEVNQPGWIQSAPAGGSYTVTVGPGIGGLAFGNYRCVADPCAKPPAKMSHWWPLDEPAGPVAHNIMGAVNGTWIGNPVSILGMVSRALRFPTTNDYVSAGPNASLNFGTGDLTIDCWVRSSDSTNTGVRVMVDHRTGTISNPTGYSFFMVNNRLGFQLGDGGPTTNWVAPLTSQNLSDGQWHHVAVTVVRTSATGGQMYVDGNVVLTFNPTVRPGNTNNNAQLWIGQRIITGPAPILGDIDEVELFRRALPATDVQAIYNARQFGKCKTTCYVPSVRTYNVGQTSMVVCFNICNYNWSQPSMTFNWSMSGLPAGGPCTINGPTMFSPSSGTVTVSAGSCVPVCVTIQRPAGLVPGQTACYQLDVNSVGSGQPGAIEFCCESQGKLRASAKWIYHDKVPDIVHVPPSGIAVSFPMQNINQPAKNFDYQIRPVPYDDPLNQAVRLNGLPPGEPVIGTLSVGPNETFDVSVNVLYDEQVRRLHEIILEADLDGDGVPEAACAIPVVPESTGTVAAPEPDGRRSVGESLGYPNPFEGTTGVRFTLPRAQKVEVHVYDVNGRVLKTLHSGDLRAGAQYVKWDGTDALGKRTGAGIYFIRVEYEGRTLNHKVVRMR
jgi:hypothetical protein